MHLLFHYYHSTHTITISPSTLYIHTPHNFKNHNTKHSNISSPKQKHKDLANYLSSSTMSRTTVVMIALTVAVLSGLSSVAAQGVCAQVAAELSPCINYLRGYRENPSKQCCDGIQQMYDDNSGPTDWAITCWCVKKTLYGIWKYENHRVSHLPHHCHINADEDSDSDDDDDDAPAPAAPTPPAAPMTPPPPPPPPPADDDSDSDDSGADSELEGGDSGDDESGVDSDYGVELVHHRHHRHHHHRRHSRSRDGALAAPSDDDGSDSDVTDGEGDADTDTDSDDEDAPPPAPVAPPPPPPPAPASPPPASTDDSSEDSEEDSEEEDSDNDYSCFTLTEEDRVSLGLTN